MEAYHSNGVPFLRTSRAAAGLHSQLSSVPLLSTPTMKLHEPSYTKRWPLSSFKSSRRQMDACGQTCHGTWLYCFVCACVCVCVLYCGSTVFIRSEVIICFKLIKNLRWIDNTNHIGRHSHVNASNTAVTSLFPSRNLAHEC